MINIDFIDERSLLTTANYLNKIEIRGFEVEKLRASVYANGFVLSYNIESFESFSISNSRTFCKNGWVFGLINIYTNCVIFDKNLKYKINVNDDYSFTIKRLNLKNFSSKKVENYERLLSEETKKYLDSIKFIKEDRQAKFNTNSYIDECYVEADYINGSIP